MTTITELRRHAKAANRALGEAEGKKRDKAAARFIGKCHRFKNNYGCAKPGWWWLYRKVLRSDGGWLYGITFETDIDGKLSVVTDAHLGICDGTAGTGWEDISEADFEKAWATALSDIQSRVEKLST